jgi:hypothetical protein
MRCGRCVWLSDEPECDVEDVRIDGESAFAKLDHVLEQDLLAHDRLVVRFRPILGLLFLQLAIILLEVVSAKPYLSGALEGFSQNAALSYRLIHVFGKVKRLKLRDRRQRPAL